MDSLFVLTGQHQSTVDCIQMASRVSILAAASVAVIGRYSSRSKEVTCSPLQKDGRFAGKTVVITGGGGTFGTEGAAYFCAQGANVVLIDSSKKSLDVAVEKVVKAMMLESAQDASDTTAYDKGVGAQITNLSVCQCDVRDELMVRCQ